MTGGEVHCSAELLHEGVKRRDRPLATYMVMANPCHANACDGRICKGHPICPDCAAGMRAGKTSWGKTGDTAEVAAIWNVPLRRTA